MAATDFIVAIELGSTDISGIAGKKNADGSINILAYSSEKSDDCIKKGVIYNLDKTTQKLTSIIKDLETKLQAGIKKVYIGVGGLSLRSIKNTETRQLGDDTRISQAIIDSMMEANIETPLLDYEILAVEPQEYKVGNNLLTEPVGTTASSIEGNYLNIIARPSVKQNIKQCLSHTGYEIAGFTISPMATADTVLTTNEKRSGCALIDLGADTTTVAIYKNNILRHVCVIPLGGNNITKDICSKQIEEDDAELIKLRYASAYTEYKEGEEVQDTEYAIDGKCSIMSRTLEDIVEARVNEIITNVFNQIKLSNYSDGLMAGIVVTGGVSNMPNIDKAITNITKIEKVRVAHTGEINLTGKINLPKNGKSNTLVGILLSGEENCCRVDPKRGHQFDFNDDSKSQETEDNTIIENSADNDTVNVEEETVTVDVIDYTKECHKLVIEASQLILSRSYTDALEVLAKAKEMNVEAKAREIDSLEKEAKRLLDEAERVKAIKEAQLQAEKQKEKQRKEVCDKLLEEAVELIDREKYKTAKEKLDAARKYNIPECNLIIEDLEEKIIKSQKNKKRSIFDRIKQGMSKASEEFFDGIK
ncbi:cell division protein FtsA [Bacteroides caecigallinarum]|uniref:Cell division protein FtsA n=1 Tax=Candidatus Phocaeicola faecigallinarum TaxID=2838732 RepID=A0A948WWK2_9BACT|nr:cell division protein FtsA [Bacteroides caecigallinarum]MBU3837765.1 cell division protein FtsA [Candidatus Phocaeicola faecigallinarum]MCF2580459.1 cell division protein FtsA [Bacteroides caecigallinarum]